MSHLSLLPLSLTISLSVPTIAIPQNATQSEHFEAFRQQARAAIDAGYFPGAAFGFVKGGEILFADGFGLADIDTARPVTADTVFPLASISKTFIGTAAAIAHNDGRFDVNAPVIDMLSLDLAAPQGDQITFTHLATHTSGIIDNEMAYDYGAYGVGELRNPVTLETYLERYLTKDGTLYNGVGNFSGETPGETYEYSNVGAALAAQTLSDAVDQPFPQITQELIFAPVGMTSTVWFKDEVPEEIRATLYMMGEAPYPLPPYALATYPDGGLHTSVRDLARYLAAVTNGGVLDGEQVIPSAAVDLMLSDLTQGVSELGSNAHVGLFWTLETLGGDDMQITLMGHNGGDPGIVTFMYSEPESGNGIIGLFNAEPADQESEEAMIGLLLMLLNTPA